MSASATQGGHNKPNTTRTNNTGTKWQKTHK